jgi:hypothetical protein
MGVWALSVKVMTWVWEHSRSKLSARLVLLAIADHANGDGVDAFPSTAQLMHKTGLSERGVQVAVAELVKLGELHVAAGGGRGRTNRYRVLMVNPAEDAPFDAENPAEKTPYSENPAENTAYSVHETPQPTTGNPAGSAPGTKKEPRATVKNSPKGSSTRTRGTRIPADFPLTDEMRDYARQFAAELLGGRAPGEQFDSFLDRKHLDFVDYWNERPGQQAVKLSWSRAWQRWMRSEIDEFVKKSRSPGNAVALRGHNGSDPYVGTGDRKIAQVDAAIASFKAKQGDRR